MKHSIAVDPVAHLFRLDTFSVLSPTFDSQNRGSLDTPPGESNHLAIIRAQRIWATAWKVVEDLLSGDEQGVGEENLGIGGRLMREEDDERRALLVQNRSEGEVDLGKAGCPSLSVKCMS